MALTRRKKNPEGNMPLGDHLREARNRLLISVAFFVVGSVIGAFYVRDFFGLINEPVTRYAKDKGSINFGTVLSNFDLLFQGAMVIGLVISSPFWLYQIWAYLQPGLTRREKKYTLGFFFAAVPLFLAGVGTAWLVFPHAIKAMFAFTPDHSTNILDASYFISFILRLHLAFGFAFLIPLVLVGANLMGVVSARQIIKAWRIVVFVSVAFSAMVAPGPDVLPMFALAAPMLVLFFVAIVICVFNDKRRARKQAAAPAPTQARPLSEIV